MPRVPAHIATTRHLSVAYPLATEAGLGHQGVLIGQDVLGGSFVYDPFVLYRQGVITNPNMVVFGQIGRGKSSFVKSYLWRQAVFGRRAWVVDPKGEYGPLARAWGVAPVALRPGGSVRLNPLDTGELNNGACPENDRQPDGAGGGARGDEAWRRRVELTASLAVACLGRHLVPRERAAIDAALTEATERSLTAQMPAPTLPDVVESLLDPSAHAARQLRTDQLTLMEDGRDVALELRRLVYGDLRGMFDGPSTTFEAMEEPSRAIAIYCRISLDRDQESESIERQEADCRKFLLGRDFEIGDVFEDRDVSAYKGVSRPAFESMMQGIENGIYGGVCVWKLDRLTRRFRESADILGRLQDEDAILLSVNDNIDTTNPMGEALIGILIAQAETESRNTSLRVSSAERARANSGKSHGGGNRCYGYTREDQIVPEEATQLRLVAKDLKAGVSMRAATQRLNDRDARTTTGRQWTRQSLAQTFRSPRLRGARIYKGETKPGMWEPIFTEAEHFELLELISHGNGFRRSPERVNNQYLLTGLIVCTHCNKKLDVTRPKEGDSRYTCVKNPGVGGCSMSIVVMRTDAFVFGEVMEYADFHKEWPPPVDALKDKLVSLQKAKARDKSDLEELLSSKYDPVNSENRDVFDRAITERMESLDSGNRAIAALTARIGKINPRRGMPVFYQDAPWQSKEVMVRKAWIKNYTNRIEVRRAAHRGGKFDPSRINIQWRLGPGPGPEDLGNDDIDAQAWNDFVSGSSDPD